MQDLWTAVLKDKTIQSLKGLLPDNTFFTGGCVRDILLNRKPKDYDIVTYSNVWALGEKIAGQLNAHLFWIDEARGVCRVVMKDPDVQVDITSPRASTIDGDLLERDITINAIGIDVKNETVFDPTGGINDIENNRIKIIGEKNILADPLRALRALRFAVQLGFSIEDDTLALIKKYAAEVNLAAPERIKQELVSALSTENGAQIFNHMEYSGLTDSLFPQYRDLEQGRHHRWPLLKHAILTALEMDRLLADKELFLPGIGDYFEEEVEAGVSRACCLRLAAFLHDIGKPEAMTRTSEGDLHFYGHAKIGALISEEIILGLAFSSRATSLVGSVISQHMRLLELACGGDITTRATYRLILAAKDCVPELLLHSLADAEATGKDPGYIGSRPYMEDIVKIFWFYYKEKYCVQKQKPILTGFEIMKSLKIPSGPKVGEFLNMVEEERAEGKIKNKNDALRFLKKISKK